jgi:hypothetical protein
MLQRKRLRLIKDLLHGNRFHTKFILFACNWCSYGGADLVRVGRMQYRPSVRGALFEAYRAIQEQCASAEIKIPETLRPLISLQKASSRKSSTI